MGPVLFYSQNQHMAWNGSWDVEQSPYF
jgi:hypothetical protein